MTANVDEKPKRHYELGDDGELIEVADVVEDVEEKKSSDNRITWAMRGLIFQVPLLIIVMTTPLYDGRSLFAHLWELVTQINWLNVLKIVGIALAVILSIAGASLVAFACSDTFDEGKNE